MSTTILDRAPATATDRRDRAPSLGRLTSIELRKTTDTRAGFWLLLVVLGLCFGVAVVTALNSDADRMTLAHTLSNVLQPAGLLLPVVGILLVSSEFSQRTALTTFAIVPRRGRVLGAKVLASLALTAAVFVACVVFAAAATAAVSDGADGAWSVSAGLLGQDALFLATAMLMGIGFGATFLASAPAIVLYFLLPTAFAALGAISALESIVEWIGPQALAPLTEGLLTGTEWGRAGTSLLLWTALPLIVGARRVLRGEIH